MAKQRFLDKIKQELAISGIAARTTEARMWLAKKAKQVRMNSGARLGFVNLGKKSKICTSISDIKIGSLYFYFYDPKTKDKLPYYDTMPLVIPIDYKPASHSESGRDAGFLGLNLHYLHPLQRTVLLDKLYTIATDDRFDEHTKLRMRYAVMVNNKQLFKEAFPCLKWYLFNHLKSNILEIDSDEWEIAAFLPFDSFMKQSKEAVWKKSNKKRGTVR